jgi:hypothetical protein
MPVDYTHVSGLDAATTYRARVRAYNVNGWGPWSQASPGFATRDAGDMHGSIDSHRVLFYYLAHMCG